MTIVAFASGPSTLDRERVQRRLAHRAANRAIAIGALGFLMSCASLFNGPQDGPNGLHGAESMSIGLGLAQVEAGRPAPWTVIETDAVGTARFVGESQGADGCRPVEVLRWRRDVLDTLEIVFCPNASGSWRPAA